jgi:hypothetical protein
MQVLRGKLPWGERAHQKTTIRLFVRNGEAMADAKTVRA